MIEPLNHLKMLILRFCQKSAAPRLQVNQEFFGAVTVEQKRIACPICVRTIFVLLAQAADLKLTLLQ